MRVVRAPFQWIPDLLNDLTGLILPRCCGGCDRPLHRRERALCLPCATDLPRNRYHDDPENRVEQVFWGRVPLASATAFLRFDSKGSVQHMLHVLKYKNDLAVGQELGERFGRELARSQRFATVEALIAVPLHPRKEHARGFNQSRVIADGIRESWPIGEAHHALQRVVDTPSQTKRGRPQRWQNVAEAFTVADPKAVAGRHLLLVDDVVTTGATLEACARVLLEIPGIRVSICALACA